jgi:lipopolysaccharide transport system ATP-binding protein
MATQRSESLAHLETLPSPAPDSRPAEADYVVEVHHLTKTYSQSVGRSLLRERLTSMFHGAPSNPFYALRDVSFRVKAGESLGILGPNGAGKSTLLSVISSIHHPDAGSVSVNGSIAALLELGSGFHYDLTGRENITLNASLLGLDRKQVRERFASIVAFSELEDFIDEPLRTYSTGMVMRLAFSVAVNTNPDILIIDEVLAVGDQQFQSKCIKKIFELKAAGHTLICVSHSAALIETLCDTGLWLNHGRAVMQGDVREVVRAYEAGATRATTA